MPGRKSERESRKGSQPPASDSHGAVHGSKTQNSGEEHLRSDQSHGRDARQQKPQAIDIHKIPKIDVTEGKEANSIARRANNIAIWSTVIGALLFAATLAVFYQTVRQTDAAIIAANAAKKSADLQKQALDSQIAFKKQSDIADAQKLQRDMNAFNAQKEFYTNSKKGVDAQIASLKETQREFESEKQAFLEVRDFDTMEYKNGVFYIKYEIHNLSDQPAQIVKSFRLLKFDKPGVNFDRKIIDKLADTGFKIHHSYVIKESPTNIILRKHMTTTKVNELMKGVIVMYVYEIFYYKNLVTNKFRKYTYSAVIYFDKKNILYELVIDENKDVLKIPN